jgi:predicted lysophospholipase L1 biosynthesis ABC-type transport system permease subunit
MRANEATTTDLASVDGRGRGWTAAARLWARADLRRRWMSLVLLGVLAGLTAGVAVAVFDGADRTDTALERLRTRTLASDAIVFATQAGVTEPDWSIIERSPGVERIGVWSLTWGSIDGGPIVGPLFAPVDDVFTATMDRPIVVSGRLADPDEPGEIMIDSTLEQSGEFHLGDELSFHAMAGFDDFFSGVPTGGTETLHIVGVVTFAPQFLFATDGMMIMSPAFVRDHRDDSAVFENAMVDLTDAPDAVDQLRLAANELGPGVPILDQQAVARRVETTTGVERTVLTMLAAVIAFAGTVLVGQAVLRSSSGIEADTVAMSAMGLTRRRVVAAAMLPHAVTALVALVVMVAVTAAVSPFVPIGLARTIDPDLGVHLDPLLLVVGAAAVIVVIAATSWSAVWSATRVGGRRTAGTTRFVGARPLTLRTGLAIGDGRGGRRGGSPLVPAVVGAAVAVTGVIGAITMRHGLEHALDHPELAGVSWDLQVTANEDLTAIVDDALEAQILATDGVERVAMVSRQSTDIDGVGTPLYSDVPAAGSTPLEPTIIAGRLATADGELTLGPATAESMGVAVGDVVNGGAVGDLRVVGLALFPPDVHAAFDEGGWISADTMTRVIASLPPGPPPDVLLAIRTAPGADDDAVAAAVQSLLGDSGAFVSPAEIPPELDNLRLADHLPVVLAVFLGLLGIAAVGHALHSSVRAQRHTLAVLRALGSTRRWLRLTIAACATALGGVAVLVGAPVGVVLGRAAWRTITERIPLGFVGPDWLVVVVVVVPLALVVANALAVWPGRRATRRAPANDLRSE